MANSELVLGQTGENWLDTQQLIAPVFFSLVASTPINKGGLFIYGNKLYKATEDIAQDAQIIISGSNVNATLASTVAEELKFKATLLETKSASLSSANAWAYTSLSFTLTKASLVFARTYYASGKPRGLAISDSSSNKNFHVYQLLTSDIVYRTPTVWLEAGTYYVWAYRETTASNTYSVYTIDAG